MKISMKACRVNANYTQNEISDKLGITRQQYIKWERGIVKLKKFQKLSFSNVVNIPLENIFFNHATCKKQVNPTESAND